MRIALVVTPLALPDSRPAPGSLDGDVIRARLPHEDAGFRVVDLDPAIDLAEQVELLFHQRNVPQDAAVLLYASCRSILSVDGELFLCFDPANPTTGDSLRDLTLSLREHVSGLLTFIVECRHTPEAGDLLSSAAMVAAACDAVAPLTTGIELLVAAHPVHLGDTHDSLSPLTRALLEAFDDAEAEACLTLERVAAQMRENPAINEAVASFTYVRGWASLELLPRRADVSSAAQRMSAPTSDEANVPVIEESKRPQSSVPPASHGTPVIEMKPISDREEMLAIEDILSESATPPAPQAALSEEGLLATLTPASLPRVIISQTPPITLRSAVEVPLERPHLSPSVLTISSPHLPVTLSEHVAAGDALRSVGDAEGALAAYKRALGMLGPSATTERAEIYIRQAKVKQHQEKRREAIAAYEKALGSLLQPEGLGEIAHREALEALVELNVAEGDWRAVSTAEERVLALLANPDERFTYLMAFGARWQDRAGDAARARTTFERARDLRPDDVGVLERLRGLYEQGGALQEALDARRRIAELTRDPRSKAEHYFDLGRHCIFDLRREDLGLEMLELALSADPTMLEPLALIARVLAERQEWSELEQAYRRMLDRVDHIPKGPVRTEVTWELCRRLGVTFRDHLDDLALALDAFEDAVHAKPSDLSTRLTAAEIARTLGKYDCAAAHLAVAAAIEPARATSYHDLFDLFQKLGFRDQAYQAACAVMFLRQAEARERFVFEEHKPQGALKPVHAIPFEAWEWLRPHERDVHAEAVLSAVMRAAMGARLAQLTAEGRVPSIDTAGRQDPEKSTIAMVRSFAWASHFLAVPAPAIYLIDDPSISLAAVVQEEPTVFAGGRVLRGCSPAELAFHAGRHLAYHIGTHRLLLYFPSIEELSACFLAAVRIVLPEVPAPAAMRSTVMDLERAIALRLTETERVDLAAAVAAFESAGSRANLSQWAAAVERCATRAGFLLAGDLEVAAGVMGSEPLGVLEPEVKVADLLAFAVSEEHHALRKALGIAIQP